jgi:hypothetical protein
MNRKITRLARGLKCSCLSTPPLPAGVIDVVVVAAACSEAPSMFESATKPKPAPSPSSAWRRVIGLKM